uniref:Transposase n=1 Tax=Meloidogyne hapla TaxID=6305 RepID=A0A1I8B4C8_MELHA
MVRCFSQRKCKPIITSITNKRARSIGVFTGFSEFIDFGD